MPRNRIRVAERFARLGQGRCVDDMLERKGGQLGPRALNAGLAIVLAVGMCLPAPALAAESAGAENAANETSANLAQSWNLGIAVVRDAATYTLSQDVEAKAPLTVALAQGEVATIDLAGHAVHVWADEEEQVAGDDAWACAIDLSKNEGAVSFIDSSNTSDASSRQTGITLEVSPGTSRAAVVYGMPANQNANSVANRVLFDGVSLELKEAGDPDASGAGQDGGAMRARHWAVVVAGSSKETEVEAEAEGKASVFLDGCRLAMESPTATAEAGSARYALVDLYGGRAALAGRTLVELSGEGLQQHMQQSGALRAQDASSFEFAEDFALDSRSTGVTEASLRAQGESAGSGSAAQDEAGDLAGESAQAGGDFANPVNDREMSKDLETADSQSGLDATDSFESGPVDAFEADAENDMFASTESPESGEIDEVGEDRQEAVAPDLTENAVEDQTPANAAEEIGSSETEELEPSGSASPEDGADALGLGSKLDSGAAEAAYADAVEGPAGPGAEAGSMGEASRAGQGGEASETALLGSTAPKASASGEDASPLLSVITQAVSSMADGTDLGVAWKSQDEGLKAPFTIDAGGTYYLSADVTAESNLVIDAAGQDVTIKFNGHKLVIDGAGTALRKTMVSVVAARSVTFDGSASTGASAIESAGEMDVWAISSTAAGCTVRANDLVVKLASKTNSQRNLNTHAVRMASGTLELTRCTVTMDMGNQSLKSSDLINGSQSEVPSAVYATADVQAVVLTDCQVAGEGTQGFGLDDLSDTWRIGNAYAVYSLAKSTVVNGGQYRATSLAGNATCLFGSVLAVRPGTSGDPVKLQANAGQIAAGVLSTAAGSVVLDTSLDFSSADEYAGVALVQTALRSSVDNGFVFGPCARQESSPAYTVLVMKGKDVQAANANGSVIGAFSASLTQEQRESVAASLANAFPQGGCAVKADGGSIVFVLEAATAVARLDDGTLFSTMAEALAGMGEGHTLTLLQDAGALSVSGVADGVIDLNQHSIASLDYSGAEEGAGLIIRNGSIAGVQSVSGYKTCVYHRAAAPLVLSGVLVNAEGFDARVCGVYAAAKAGALALTDATQVKVKVSRHSATIEAAGYGVYMPTGGPALTMTGSAVSVFTASAGSAVYGVVSTTSATMTNSIVSVVGATGSSYAASVGGSLTATGTTFSARTSGLASLACGVCARTAAPKATDIALDSCNVVVSTAEPDVSGSVYTCLLGANVENGTPAPTGSWKLSGESVYSSAGGLHVGLNVGGIEVDPSFKLNFLSDGALVVSQARSEGDVGVTLPSAALPADAQRIAGLFEAANGSYYEGWVLVPQADSADGAESGQALAWRPSSTRGGQSVEVSGSGGVSTFATLAQALENARSGDTVKILEDLSEPGIQMVSQDDLELDLNGHTLFLRGAGGAKVGADAGGAALTYSGTGALSVRNGVLEVSVGLPQESGAGPIYQGIAIVGAGTLDVADDVALRVAYAGSTAPSAIQRNVVLRGIALSKGELRLKGSLAVDSSVADGVLGAVRSYGIYADPASDDSVQVRVEPSASVSVDNASENYTVKNLHYPESNSMSIPQGGPAGLREIVIDPETDADFYQDVCKQFRYSASFDDPGDSTARNTFFASIYYADGMTLAPDDDNAWYKGLKVWAYSDVVKPADVGKASAMVPTHFFMASSYDVPNEAYGIATPPTAAGKATLRVAGAVNVQCANGGAWALSAESAEKSDVAWTCTGASLSATADSRVHPLAGEAFDLRNYIDFSIELKNKVAYSGATLSKIVRFGCASGRGAVVDGNTSFELDGAMSFNVAAGDAAAIQADCMKVGGSFSLTEESQPCTVANASGENVQDAVFAEPAGAVDVNASLFADAYARYDAVADEDGQGVWRLDEQSSRALFKVGDAVVARFAGPGKVNLSGPSAAAMRMADQRQEYELAGWSLGMDEHATSGYRSTSDTVRVTQDCVYYAVYTTGMTTVPVTFSNVHDEHGALVEPVSLVAQYGQTLKEALDQARLSLPAPADYRDDSSGITYKFVGWFPYTPSAAVGPLLYDDDTVLDVPVTLGVSGVSDGGLNLRAVYEAAAEGQHVVRFVVDGFVSSCVVDEGARPVYTMSNSANTNYVVPAKQATETGKTFTFTGWYVDADGDDKLGDEESVYPSILPAATEDVTYTADWTWKWSDVTYTFYVKHYDEKTKTVNPDGVREVKTTYEKVTQDVADSIAKIGSVVGTGGKLYTLKGWSTRKTDVDPLYDANRLLPSVSGGDRAINDTYARTYYGVYDISDHMVKVTFFDGAANLGSASVVAAAKSVDGAFAETGAAKPADKSAEQVFLGWSTEKDATSAVDGTATTIETLAPGTQSELSLYAVFGKRPSYSVRLRSQDGLQLLYQLTVKRGDTVNAVLAAAGQKIELPLQEGRYFTGWRTATGVLFDLDAPVNGAVECYASFGDVTVTTKDADDISANVSVSYDASVSALKLDGANGLVFSLEPRDTADRPLVSEVAKNGCEVLKSYDIRLYATSDSGIVKQITGDFGLATLKVYVGARYRNASVRAFWLGEDGGSEVVKSSSVKEIDEDGYITLNIGNFTIGDEAEGGNLVIAYVEGGKGNGSLEASSPTQSQPSVPAKDEDDEKDAKSGGALVPAASTPSTLSPTLSGSGNSLSAGATSSRLSTSLASGLSASGSTLAGSSGLSSLSGSSSTLSSQTAPSGASSAASASKAQLGGLETSEDATADEGWDSSAVVLILILLALAAVLGRRLWLLLAGKRKSDDDEQEDFDEPDAYAKGIQF